MGRLRAAAVLAVALHATAAWAHGGLAMEQDSCKLSVGRLRMHFAGYQGQQRREFCEDIPATGPTTIVLDFVDDALRDLPVEVRIVRNLPGTAPDNAPTIYSLPARHYPQGTLVLEHDFREPGDYVGLVQAGANREHRAVFPFAVGQDRFMVQMLAGAGLLLGLGAALFWYGRSRLVRRPSRGEGGAP